MRRLIDLVRSWSARQAPAPEPVEPTPLDDLHDFIRRDVASGFYDDDVILRNAADVFGEDMDADLLRSESQRLLREALAAHRIDQRGWPETTDCDRLDAAFDALDAMGIVSRQNFTCCGSCGAAEIGDEIEDRQAKGFVVRGYAFYYAQDTESAVDGDGLYLNYGAVDDGEAAAVAIGHEVVAELARHGLTAEWSGDWSSRIAVPLDWKRRR